MSNNISVAGDVGQPANMPSDATFSIGAQPVPYFIGAAASTGFRTAIESLVSKRTVVGIVCDRNVELFVRNVLLPIVGDASSAEPVMVIVDAAEDNKTISTVEAICDMLWRGGLRSDGVVVAVGGGIVLNTAGVAASLLLRGLPLVSVPTTVLAAVDGVVSAKQAVNSKHVRNGLGSYHPPHAAFGFPEVFETLSAQRKLDGVFELAKNCLIGADHDSEQILRLTESVLNDKDTAEDWLHAIAAGVDAKRALLRDDPHEKRAALIFEYGHTIAHWLEMSRTVTLHGFAVGLGALTASLVAQKFGLGGREQHESLLIPGLRTMSPIVKFPEFSELIHDRKRQSTTEPGVVPMLLSNGAECVGPKPNDWLWKVPADLVEQSLREAVRQIGDLP